MDPSPALVQTNPAVNGNSLAVFTHGLSKKFNRQSVLQDIHLEIPAGKIFGFIGPSGSGKTTTVRVLTGAYEPTAGEVRVLGEIPTEFKKSTREKIGYMPQHAVLYPDLSVWRNINFVASVYGVGFRRKHRLDELLEFVELSEHRSKLVSNISGGMKRRLSLAATLVHQPQLIFLDEPTAGIDPILRRKFWDYFKLLQQEDRTLFITTQYVNEAAYCDFVGVMAEGRLLMVETPEGLRRQAFGGDVIALQTVERIPYHQLLALQELPYVLHRAERVEEKGVRLVVDEANKAMPLIVDWCKSQDILIDSIEEDHPPFDDTFVEIITKATNHEA